MNTHIDEITIVGGGDAGLIAALTLNELTDGISINLIDNFDEDIPQVGKSTTRYIQTVLHDNINIDRSRFISEVKPVWKGSVYFKNWCGCDTFHIPFDDLSLVPNEPGRTRFEELYYRYENKEYDTIGTEIVEQGSSPIKATTKGPTIYPGVAYHLPLKRFNRFLRKLADERGITLIDDRVEYVNTTSDRIKNIASKSRTYDSDLYLDATGFKRKLISLFDNKFVRFDIPLDSALVTRENIDLEDIVPATVITSGTAGWFWKIDTYEKRDHGYVYSSSHISHGQAKDEFLKYLNIDISDNDFSTYSFESGKFSSAWVENCVAVGNALGFVEPLQSTALTTNGYLMEKLAVLLSEHRYINHSGLRDLYNKHAQLIWENVFNFVFAHYNYTSHDGEFWRDMNAKTANTTVQAYQTEYLENGFTSFSEFDSQKQPDIKFFNQWMFYRLFRSLNVDSTFYENLDIEVSAPIGKNIRNKRENEVSEVRSFFPYENVY